jgi:hypothetical protein
MIIKLTPEQHHKLRGEYLEIDGEEFEYVDENVDIDDSGKTKMIVWKRPSDNKYFITYVYYCRYGYEDYGYEKSYQDLNLYEVEKKEIISYKWIMVDK